MRRLRPLRLRFAASAAALCLLLLAACEDPSGVGLVDLDEGDPLARTLPADDVRIDSLADATGAFLTDNGFDDFRGLAGRVDDPSYGTTTASAFLDVLAPSGFPEGFRDRPVEEATLLLRRTYVYGDTLGTTRLDVRQIAEDWNAAGAVSDTLFPVQDDVITSFDVAPGDSLIEVALPESWIAANDTTLRSDDFSTLFHGFRLSPGDQATAVYGFSGASSLRLISEDDTVSYNVSELFSGIEPPPADPAAGELARLQDGTGRGLMLGFEVDELGESTVISRAVLRVTADTSAATTGLPAGFVRPVARELALYGLVDGGTPVLIAEAALDEETQTFSFASAVLGEVFQDLVLGRSEVEGFAVGFPASASSLDVLPLVRGSEAGCEADELTPCAGPRAVFLLTPSGG
jgi:hypothetical protein